jgi:hypothetical protein
MRPRRAGCGRSRAEKVDLKVELGVETDERKLEIELKW